MINLVNSSVITPAFVYDETRILENISTIKKVGGAASLLYSLKPFSVFGGLSLIGNNVDGFSVSSLYEARLAREALGDEKSLHYTSPGLSLDHIETIAKVVDYINLNSLTQLARYQEHLKDRCNLGVRVNPELSLIEDNRYNPCKPNSKLGIPIFILAEYFNDNPDFYKSISGLHFHTNCESTNFMELYETIRLVDLHLGKHLNKLKWINIGGGYICDPLSSNQSFSKSVEYCRNKYEVEVFIEPGKGIVGDAGNIVSSVIDLFETRGSHIAVLDTSINHMPEVFEYQFRPTVLGQVEDGPNYYQLVGASCLAGDEFGRYGFEHKLEIGSQIVFPNMGAYTLTKANMFNGIALPNIYRVKNGNTLDLVRQYTYEDYKSLYGAI